MLIDAVFSKEIYCSLWIFVISFFGILLDAVCDISRGIDMQQSF